MEQALYYLWFVLALVLNSKTSVYCEANDVGVLYNERLCVYKRLLAYRLHGKVAELCLANS